MNTHIYRCETCGGPVDETSPNYYESQSAPKVKHVVCHEEGGPGDFVLDLADEQEGEVLSERQYQCGHKALGPPEELPQRCPHDDCGWFADMQQDVFGGGVDDVE